MFDKIQRILMMKTSILNNRISRIKLNYSKDCVKREKKSQQVLCIVNMIFKTEKLPRDVKLLNNKYILNYSFSNNCIFMYQ